MKAINFFTSAIVITAGIFGLYGCHAGGNFTGREYMPDMAHSIAYETNLNTYYHYNHFTNDTAYEKNIQPRRIVGGTIARGFTSFFWSGGDFDMLKRLREGGYNMNGHVIYNYPEGDSGRALAMAAITTNPFPATKSGVAKGKELYEINCAICHGEKGDGNGYIWRDGEGPYPNKPANFLEAEIVGSSEGRYYHAIMRGKGVMGAYADKLSFEERWNVIHYIRSLQKPDYAISDDGEVAAAKTTVANFDLAAAEAMLKAGKAKGQTLTLDNLKFKTGSAEIDMAASKDLEDLFKILAEDPKMTISLSGHTDNVGDAAKNMALSQARAEAVIKFLTTKGIAASRLAGKGYGDTKPVGDNKTAEGKALNRRTDVTITAQ